MTEKSVVPTDVPLSQKVLIFSDQFESGHCCLAKT